MKGKDAYLKEALESAEGQMRKRLLNWGGAMELCRRKQEQMKRAIRLREESWTLPLGEERKRLAAYYEAEIDGQMAQIGEILQRKQEMDGLISRLGAEEQQFLILRYEKGYGFDYIALQMHMSRASCFRLGKKVVEDLCSLDTIDDKQRKKSGATCEGREECPMREGAAT